MSNLFTSSIGKKLIMSITGSFLILFLLFHASMNVVAIFSADAYNLICAFLGANWYALAGTLVIAAGVVVHIFYATFLTLTNRAARGSKRYDIAAAPKGVSWSSRNMYVLGLVVLFGLLLHLYNFWFNMQYVEIAKSHELIEQLGLEPQNGARHLAELFSSPVYCAIYLVWFFAIWFHLTHGMWSMMQTAGWANKKWYRRLKGISHILSTLIFLAFAAVVIVFYLRSIGFTCGA